MLVLQGVQARNMTAATGCPARHKRQNRAKGKNSMCRHARFRIRPTDHHKNPQMHGSMRALQSCSSTETEGFLCVLQMRIVHCELRGLAPVLFYPPMPTSCMSQCRRVNLGVPCAVDRNPTLVFLNLLVFAFFLGLAMCKHGSSPGCCPHS